MGISVSGFLSQTTQINKNAELVVRDGSRIMKIERIDDQSIHPMDDPHNSGQLILVVNEEEPVVDTSPYIAEQKRIATAAAAIDQAFGAAEAQFGPDRITVEDLAEESIETPIPVPAKKRKEPECSDRPVAEARSLVIGRPRLLKLKGIYLLSVRPPSESQFVVNKDVDLEFPIKALEEMQVMRISPSKDYVLLGKTRNNLAHTRVGWVHAGRVVIHDVLHE